MHRTTATVLTVLTSLVATLPLVAGALPASAETVTVPDARGDVSDGRWRAAYDQDLADVRRSTLDHQSKRVVLKLTMVEVKSRGDWAMTAEGRLRLPGGQERWMVLDADGHGGKTVEVQDADRSPLPCAGATGALRPDTDQVIVAVPRTCLGDPDWVRYGAGMTMSWGLVSSRDDARSDEGFSLPQDFKRRLGTERIRPGRPV